MFEGLRHSKTLLQKIAQENSEAKHVKVHYTATDQVKDEAQYMARYMNKLQKDKWHTENNEKPKGLEVPHITIHKKEIDPFRIERNVEHVEKLNEIAMKHSIEINKIAKMNYLVKLVEQWSINKDLHKADSSKQFLKVTEEVGEVAAALARGQHTELQDGIGDVVVTLIILAQQNGLTLEDCLEHAYNEIADRKGKMINGVFVKQENLDLDEQIKEELNGNV